MLVRSRTRAPQAPLDDCHHQRSIEGWQQGKVAPSRIRGELVIRMLGHLGRPARVPDSTLYQSTGVAENGRAMPSPRRPRTILKG